MRQQQKASRAPRQPAYRPRQGATRAEQTRAEALETLRRAGLDPRDPMVARIGEAYRAHDENVERERRSYAEASADVAELEKVVESIGKLKINRLRPSTLADVQAELARRKAGLVPPEPAGGRGHPVDKATRHVLLDFQSIASWRPEVIEACLVVSGVRGVAREGRLLRRLVGKARKDGYEAPPHGVIVVKRADPK